jgi:hypothetical protein
MKRQSIAAVVICAGLSLSALAQEGAGASDDDTGLFVLPEFKSVDRNKDGMIDLIESETLAATLVEEHGIAFQFLVIDVNHDDLINNQEYVAYDAALAERLGIA